MEIGQHHLFLKAYGAFDATARHLSMRRAAEELGVMPSAVSHQIRAIESVLEVPLFERRHRQLALSAEGRLLHEVRTAFEDIAATRLRLLDDAFAGTLSIMSPPAFSSQWLMPRLPAFLARYPELTLRCRARPVAQASSAFAADVGIVFGARELPGRVVEPLVELDMFPVCAPAYARGWEHGTIDALREATLVHENDGALWTAWFETTATEQFRARRDVYAGTTHDALALAAAGGVVAINDDFMGSALLRDGAPLRPFGERALLPPGIASELVEAFRRWIRAEVRGTGWAAR